MPPGSRVRRTAPDPSTPSSSNSAVDSTYAADRPTESLTSGPSSTTANAAELRLGRRVRGLGRGLVGDHGGQRELAALVDLGDLDLDLVADLDHVVDVLHALAAGDLAQLRDVQQAVLAGQQRDEGAEGGGLHDRAQEALAHLGHGRVGDLVDRRPGLLRRGAGGGADVDGAVVL